MTNANNSPVEGNHPCLLYEKLLRHLLQPKYLLITCVTVTVFIFISQYSEYKILVLIMSTQLMIIIFYLNYASSYHCKQKMYSIITKTCDFLGFILTHI